MKIEIKKVVKGIAGYKNSAEDSYTHVIYDREAYEKEQRIINKLKYDIEEIKAQAIRNVENEKKTAKRYITQIKVETETEINKISHKLDAAHQEITELENINDNLIRIATERANAARGITPKKEHIGYILLNAEEAKFYYRYRRTTETFPCWKIRLQTPYSIQIELPAATKLVETDLLQKFGAKIGLSNVYQNGSIEENNINFIQELWNNEKNFIFKSILKLNAIKGFWEVEYWTKNIIKIIPELLPLLPKEKDFSLSNKKT